MVPGENRSEGTGGLLTSLWTSRILIAGVSIPPWNVSWQGDLPRDETEMELQHTWIWGPLSMGQHRQSWAISALPPELLSPSERF